MTVRGGLVVGAGIVAAMHVAKLPPALGALRAELQLSLVQAGFLLSAVQLAGMILGVLFGAWTDGIGHRRSMICGLLLLAAASLAGATANSAAVLLALRVVEGCGFLLVVLAAPPLLRQNVAAQHLQRMLGWWSAYMPLATAAAFVGGPFVVAAWGWHAWWALLAVPSLLIAASVDASSATAPAPSADGPGFRHRLGRTLRAAGPWAVALAFGCYSAQWLAVVGFLPSIYLGLGWSAGTVALATGAVALANALGNIAAGRALQRGWRGVALLRLGYAAMALGGMLAFVEASWAPAWLRWLAVLMFSGVGGVVPATLFTLAVRLAPEPQAVGTTVGWVQQLSALGQFCGPPLVAWVAASVGGWRFSGVVTATLAGCGLLLAQLLARLVARADARKGPSPVSPSTA